MKKSLSLVVALLLATFTLSAFEAVYHFEENDAKILDSGEGKFHGTYHPSATKDNDTPETRDPERYRKEGQPGKALYFFHDLKSYGTIPCPWLSDGLDNLYLSVKLKRGKRSIQYFVGNKSDVDKRGFSLMRWGVHWRLAFGDGKEHQVLKIPMRARGDSWVTAAFSFEAGKVVFYENGSKTFETVSTVKRIAGGTPNLTLGNYPGRKDAYPAECGMDELLISDTPEIFRKTAEQVFAENPRVTAVCMPVDGAEHLYGNRKTLHTFREAPVGVTFKLFFDKAEAAELVLTVPEGVRLSEAFCSNHNAPDICFPVEEPNPGEFHVRGLRSDRRDENVSCMLEVPENFTEGEVKWSAVSNGKEQKNGSFTLKVLPLPDELPDGEFYAMSYQRDDIAFFNKEIVRRIGKLCARSGLIGKGRYYRSQPRRVGVDEILRDEFGFKLYEISLWGGPQRGLPGCEVPLAVAPDGKEKKTLCLRQLVRDGKAVAAYRDSVKNRVLTDGTVGAVLDFEPWGRTGKECFCKSCIGEFAARFDLPKEITPKEILAKHAEEWTLFWVDTTAGYMKMMADAYRAASPEGQVWDYTYVYPYSSDAALHKRFGEIPKDPRLNEKFLDGSMLSLYHINGREAFDALRLSRRHLRKDIVGISLISRHDDVTGSYTSVAETLSPQQIYQKAVLSGALGHKFFAIYPGDWIDGSMYAALHNAVRDVRLHEDFYRRGADVTESVAAEPADGGKETAYLAHRNGGRTLVTFFNFSAKPQKFTCAKFGTVTVSAHGVVFKEF